MDLRFHEYMADQLGTRKSMSLLANRLLTKHRDPSI